MEGRSETARGLRWLLAGLAIELVGLLLVLAEVLAFTVDPGFGLDLATRWALSLVLVAVPVAAIGVGAVAVPALRKGRDEMGPAHSSAIRHGFRALVPAAVAGGTYLALGLVLGFVFLGDPANPGATALAYALVVGVRGVAGLVLTASLGLFLFWTIRDLGTGETTFLAGTAFALGILGAIQSWSRGAFAPSLADLGTASVVLWTAAYVAAWLRVRRGGLDEGRHAVAA